MFYAHVKLSNGVTVKVDAESLDFSAVRPICGTEYPIELDKIEELPNGLHGSAPFCDACSEELHKLSPIPEGETSREFAWLNILTKSNYPSNLFAWALRRAPHEARDAAADWMTAQVPGHHHDKRRRHQRRN